MRTNLNIQDQERRHLLANALKAYRKVNNNSFGVSFCKDFINFPFTSNSGLYSWKASLNINTGKIVCAVGSLNGNKIYKHF